MREYGSEHSGIILPDNYFANLNDLGREITYLRTGREALLYVSLNIIEQLHSASENNSPTILFPAYCCWSMSEPFKMSGWSVVYYRLNEDLTVDIDYLKSLLHKHNPYAILTMNFFGSADTRHAVDCAKNYDKEIFVIEDFSHCTFSIKDVFNERINFYVSSIRKSIGISDGAIVISDCETNNNYIHTNVTNFQSIRLEAQKLKELYSYTKNQQLKDTFLHNIRQCESILNNFKKIHSISPNAHKMLATVNGGWISSVRRANMQHLWTLLDGKVKTIKGIEKSFDKSPFSMPILVENRDVVQQNLAKKGLYTQVLWPISPIAQKNCPVSKMMNDMMLSIPIDQRFDWDDIEDIANIIFETYEAK